jgi:penicillin-binding protein 1A
LRRIDRRQGWRGPVAHLSDETAQKTLLARAAAEYGDDAFTRDQERWRLALVTEVNARQARVKVGSLEALLPLRKMQWASKYDRNTGVNDVKINKVDEAIEAGDVVWVRPAHKRRSWVTEIDQDAAAVEAAAADPSDSNQGAGAAPAAPAAKAPEPPEVDESTGLVVVELGQVPRVEAALYTMAHDTGYVEAMEGGLDFDRSQFNRTTQACRQPGSVFKAIYYGLALDTGEWNMGSVLEDKPYVPEPGEEWNPQNIGQTLDGKVLLRTALIKSLNLPSIRLFISLGADKVVAWARRLGFTTELIADRALSLGASCVRTDELSRAFAIYVRGGSWIDPIYMRRVIDKRGQLLLDQRHPLDPTLDIAGRLDRMGTIGLAGPKQVVDERTAFLITRLMREVVTAGIGGRATQIGVPAGGKSGTASKNAYTTDTWFVGFTSRHMTAAWMGDDTYERSLGDEDASYTTATPMWTQYMAQVVAGIPHEQLPLSKPAGITSKNVDARNGEAPVAGMPSATLYFKD